MVNDAQTQNSAPQSMSEWVAEHCRFNIGELDNLEWQPDHWRDGHFAYASGASYFAKGEAVVRCTHELMDRCMAVCPMQVDTIKYYLDNGSVRAVPN